MSNPSKQQASLFSFFNKKPGPPSTPKTPQAKSLAAASGPSPPTPKPTSTPASPQQAMPLDQVNAKLNKRPRVSYKETDTEDDDDDDDDEVMPTVKGKAKRRRRQIIDDDSEDEFNPGKVSDDDDDDQVDAAMSEDEDDEPVRRPLTQKKISPVSPLQERFKNISVQGTPGKLAPKPTPRASSSTNFLMSTKQEKADARTKAFKEKNQDRYKWLEDIRDINMNRPNDPDYDPRTLHVPKAAFTKFTPFERQFWEIKSKHWDELVFFKKGKFYELYEKDADVGHQEFDLKMTDRTNMRMVGVPESSYDHWASQFVHRGYKVARVDQMENAIGKSLREREQQSKADKVIQRQLTAVLTAGTLVDAGLLTSDLATYCMAIKEHCATAHAKPQYGICFVDTSTAEFNLVSFEDDMDRTLLRTLIMQIQPKELVVEKGRLSGAATRLLKDCLTDPIWNHLIPESEFWDARVTTDEIRLAAYFTDDDKVNMEANDGWPEALQLAANDDVLLSAVGGLLWYLRSNLLDKQLFSAKNIRAYDPVQDASRLVLDGQTLENLEILQNSTDGSTNGTVYKLLANSITPFGKRLFTEWLRHPLRIVADIHARQDAVEDLMLSPDLQDVIAYTFTVLPDLERLISRVHSGTCKVPEFLAVLEGFKNANALFDKLRTMAPALTSTLLKSIIEDFPLQTDALDYFNDAFIVTDIDMDYQKAKVIIPKDGVNDEWDSIVGRIKDLEQEFKDHIQEMKRQLKCSRLEYTHMGKEIYQIEAPKNTKVPGDWKRMSTTAKVDRYWNPTVQNLVTEYKEQLEIKSAFVKTFAVKVYREFDAHYQMWLGAVKAIAHLDALWGLAKGSTRLGGPSCRPVIVDQEESMLDFEELRHPCVTNSDFIPNDTKLGGDETRIMVLTGPNMGGKSTLLRQTCIAIIMAQLGGYVPAKSCKMTPCDRIYTRIGANDNIVAGQSTFMVELTETSKILHQATPRSMVILDELGRGTSTFDGVAIAYAVLHYMATYVGCLTLFATHYHTLCDEFEHHPSIRNMHMSYMMDEDEHKVIFLYKLVDGVCSKSFGMNVATMAGLPKSIIDKASLVSENFEKSHKFNLKQRRKDALPPSVYTDLRFLLNTVDAARPDARAAKQIVQSLRSLGIS